MPFLLELLVAQFLEFPLRHTRMITKSEKKNINAYNKTNRLLDSGKYHNIVDMNVGLVSFAAFILQIYGS